MKKTLQLITLLAIITTVLFNFVACSAFGKVQKELETIGYSLIENEETETSEEAKDDERVTNVHVFTNASSLSALEVYKVTLVTVIEFKATKDLVEYFNESDTLQGLVTDIQEDGTVEEVYNQLKEKGFACLNCIIIPVGLDASNVLTAIKGLN